MTLGDRFRMWFLEKERDTARVLDYYPSFGGFQGTWFGGGRKSRI